MSDAPPGQRLPRPGRVPRFVLAAPASGQGKTTVAVGLMAALARRGLEVAPAKVGPDYIDPGFHALATGRPGRNLDPWLTSPELVTPLLLHGFQTPRPADLAVVEGVMGLFDGQIGTDGFSSTAHVARLTHSPVVLVVDISSTSRTVGALVQGMARFDPEVHIAGVVLNKSGSPRHTAEVRRAVEGVGIPVLGVLPRDAGLAAPSRHLGLVPAAERADAASQLDLLAGQVEQHLDLEALVRVADGAPDLDGAAWSPEAALSAAGLRTPHTGRRPVVAVAGGRAFTFRYAETDELLRAAGCDPVVFDPATDAALPPGTCGLYLGGGFPEAHLPALSGNTELLDQVRRLVLDGLPTVAECAGLLYLCTSLDGQPLVGAVPAAAAMHPRLTLRYGTATLPGDGVLGAAGTTVHTHEFHRTRAVPSTGPSPAWLVDGRPDGFSLDPRGSGTPSVHAAYAHVHWAGNPHLPAAFARAVHAFATAGVGTPPGATDPAPAIPGPAGPSAPGGAIADAPIPRPAVACAVGGAAPSGTTPRTEPTSRLESTSRHGAGEPPTDPLDHHGDAEVRGSGLVDLAVNVRRSAPPAWLQQRLRDAVADLASYPDAAAARAALARRHGVPEACVLPTNGAAEAFTLVALAIEGRAPAVVHPQFTEPEAALRRAGRVPERIQLDARTGFRLAGVRLDPRLDLVVVGNPTNPTGVLHSRRELERLRQPGRVLVVDEAFIDTIPGERESLLQPGADLTGLLVLRSLTKTWALAGLRAGYVVGDPGLVAALAHRQTPWSVSAPAAMVMADTSTPQALAEVDRQAMRDADQRRHLVAALRDLGLSPVAGEAPFVLVQAPPGTREALRAEGFAVRRCDTFPGLDATWLRVAVRDRATTDAFARALSRVLDAAAQCTASPAPPATAPSAPPGPNPRPSTPPRPRDAVVEEPR